MQELLSAFFQMFKEVQIGPQLITAATTEARLLKHARVTTAHLFFEVVHTLDENDAPVEAVLAAHDVTEARLHQWLKSSSYTKKKDEKVDMHHIQKAMEYACNFAYETQKRKHVTHRDLLIGLIEDCSDAVSMLKAQSVDVPLLDSELRAI